MSNLLVIDKNCFQGISENILSEFVKNYHVVLTYILCVECLISKDRDSLDLLSRIQKIIRAGAYYAYSPFNLCEKEKKAFLPVDSIIDENSTNAIRTGILSDDGDYFKHEAKCYWQTVQPIVKGLLRIGEKFYANIQRDMINGMRKEDMVDKASRFKSWVQATDQSMNKFIKKLKPDIASYLTPDWYNWCDIRLRIALSLEWAWQKAKCGSFPKLKYASHDFHDMQYVTYLSRADGILTRDRKLMDPLARAAFPEKDVFFSLDEVPEEYLCNCS